MRLSHGLLAGCALIFMLGCGGGGAGSGSSGTSAERADEAEGGNRTQGGRRLAGEDSPCDHGGAAERTCQVGLYCCYGPPDDPGELGRCMDECPEY